MYIMTITNSLSAFLKKGKDMTNMFEKNWCKILTKKLFTYFAFLAIILIAFGSIYISTKTQETFTLYQPANYPSGQDYPILQGDYPLKPDAHLSDLGSEDLYKFYPVFPAGSYSQETNNIRYWKTPNNGKCTPASFCGALYSDKKLHIPPPPPMLPWDSGIRVNYYDSKE